MNTFKLFILLALIPTTFSVAAEAIMAYKISGLWTDSHNTVTFEIIKKGENLYLRDVASRFAYRGRLFYHRGRGLYEDCTGRSLLVDSYSRITYRIHDRRHKRSFILYKRNGSNRRGYSGSSYSYKGSKSYGSGINGSWYCPQHNFTIFIEPFQEGLRVKRQNQSWHYYTLGRDNRYFDERGNYYQLTNDQLRYINRNDSNRNLGFIRR